MSSISKSLPFQMARVSTRVPYQPQPRTITTPEAAIILSSFTFLQLFHLHPSISRVFAQRVVIVPPAKRSSIGWRGIARRRHGSTTLSILSGRRLNERENRAHFPYRRSAKTSHTVSQVGMAPTLSGTMASTKTHSPMAQATAGMYMTYHYQAHMYIAQWREQAKSDPIERTYNEKMGILLFVNMN